MAINRTPTVEEIRLAARAHLHSDELAPFWNGGDALTRVLYSHIHALLERIDELEAKPDPGAREDILTHSGQYFDFLHPERWALSITDIAHGLSKTCRFNGQCREFYSVAQHSVYVSRIVPEQDAYAALFHDCAEAFLGDVTRPLKRLLPEYRRLEKRIEAVLFAKLNIPYPLPASVKRADVVLLANEQERLMPPHDDEWAVLKGVEPDRSIIVTPLSPEESFDAFIERYKEVCP